ncbi:hypothetical protein EDD86DRAFT_207537 [Gorgonomyces haynaldii]|nr:hypothetical protein EDD86DRAFT_207537 [Gorgonomyces haynaldii]
MRSKSDARGDKRPKRKGETLHPPQLSQKRNSDPGFFKPVFVNNQYSMEQSMLNFSDSLETMSNLSQQEDMSRFLSVYDGFGRGRSLSQPDLSTFSDIPLFDHTDSSATLPSLLLTPATVDTIQHNFDRWETMSNHSSPGAQNSFGTSPVFNAAPIYSNPPSPLAVSPHMYAPSPIGSMPQDQFDPSFEFYSEQPPLFDKNVPTITLDPADNQDLFDVPPSAYGNYRTPSRQSMTSVSSYGAHSDLNEVPYENSVDTTLLNQFLENLSSVGGAD